MASPREFSRRINRRAALVQKNRAALVRRVVLTVHRTVVEATPIDEGTAKSNWVITTGRPNRTVVRALVPGKRGSTTTPTIAAALAKARIESTKIRGSKSGTTAFISNNLDYIGKLNAGSSRQAPANFVLKAALSARSVLSSVRITRSFVR